MKFKMEIDLTLFRRDIRRKENGKQSENDPDFFTHAREIIQRRKSMGQYNTARNYQTAINSLLHFYQNQQLRCNNFTSDLIGHYERWLAERNVSANTSSCYMRSLRAMFNVIKGDGGHVFKNVYTGRMPTEKRAATPDDIQRIRRLPLRAGSHLFLCRDLFLMSLYCQGMAFVDMAHLRTSNISGHHIRYQRHKTRHPVVISLEPPIMEILNRYCKDQNEFVFPILTATGEEACQRQYHSALVSYNRSLKVLARRAGISHRLTSYVPRHTWASLAYQGGVDLSVIAQAMGHTRTRTTLIYIKPTHGDCLAEANRCVFNALNCTGQPPAL